MTTIRQNELENELEGLVTSLIAEPPMIGSEKLTTDLICIPDMLDACVTVTPPSDGDIVMTADKIIIETPDCFEEPINLVEQLQALRKDIDALMTFVGMQCSPEQQAEVQEKVEDAWTRAMKGL